MEEEIVILVQHSGGWDNEHNFNNFIVDGLTLKESSNLDTILDEITKILGIYASMDTVEIKYSVKQNYTPMKIYNDRSLRWYLDLKRKSCFTDFSSVYNIEGEIVTKFCQIRFLIIQLQILARICNWYNVLNSLNHLYQYMETTPVMK